MKLVKCKKCGATVMTSETLLSNMQDEYNSLVNKSKHVKGADKNIIVQQLSLLKKMMTAVVHSTSEAETRKYEAYNYLCLLKSYVRENALVPDEKLSELESEARALTAQKIKEDDKRISELYGDFINHFYNNTKSDPTAKEALQNINT